MLSLLNDVSDGINKHANRQDICLDPLVGRTLFGPKSSILLKLYEGGFVSELISLTGGIIKSRPAPCAELNIFLK